MYNSKCVYYKQAPDSKNYYALIIKKKNKRHYMYNFSGRSLMVTSMFSCYHSPNCCQYLP